MAEAERQTADLARREKLADCNCYPRGKTFPNFFGCPEKFEAAANLPCPAHGFRRLGVITAVNVVDTTTPGAKLDEKYVRLNRLAKEYRLRVSQLPPLSPELEYDSDDL
jgi:hypothetical protein